MIEDWEYRNAFLELLLLGSKAATIEEKYQEAVSKVKAKYWGFVQKEDVYFFVGTQYKWQNRNAPNPYVNYWCISYSKE